VEETTPGQQPICTLLEWDSHFFGHRIARLNCSRLDQEHVERAIQWCRDEKIDCLYFLSDSDDALTVRLCEQNQFRQTDVRLTFERFLADLDIPEAAAVRPARPDDLGALRAIAAQGHRDSRFYFDGHFNHADCDRFYETWIENSFRGFAQAVLVAESAERPAGYVTCHLRERESQLGLIGVAEAHQGEGLGTMLVQGFLAWSLRQGARRATVVTQGRNVRAQRLYQRNSFVTSSFQLWYHRWFLEGD
jgi:dTDP-4-amino-4,6-dideoxy-D-galactose acyltransferase